MKKLLEWWSGKSVLDAIAFWKRKSRSIMKKIRAIVSGRVQGVGFRMSTLSQARKIGVSGYVRNLASGDVEIVALGEPDRVDELLQWAEIGPASAVVRDVKVETLTSDVEEFIGFEIRR